MITKIGRVSRLTKICVPVAVVTDGSAGRYRHYIDNITHQVTASPVDANDDPNQFAPFGVCAP